MCRIYDRTLIYNYIILKYYLDVDILQLNVQFERENTIMDYGYNILY